MADLDRPDVLHCARCGKKIKVSPTGRLPVYCSPNCRQMHYAKRARAKTKLPPPLTDEERQRRLLWQMLIDLKVIAADTPMPPPHKPEDAS